MERRELLTTIAGVAALGTACIDPAGADGDGEVGSRETDTMRDSGASLDSDAETVRVDVVLVGDEP